MLKKKVSLLSRVDVQASIIAALTTLCSSLFISWACYSYTLESSMNSLRERTDAIYKRMEQVIDPTSFYDINTVEDMEKELYIFAKDTMLDIKETADVLYLYTAKQNKNGDFVYVIDGLHVTDDFRIPGDAIEPEIIDEMQRALSGEYVYPEAIKNTSWGKIFITYLPFHAKDESIIGVLGIEFEAENLYNTYTTLFYAIPFISLFFCVLSALIAFRYFRRISNPHFKDIANTDVATGLKNRNAFEMDFANLHIQGHIANKGIIAIDLDKLKFVNDQLGHNFGDAYIKLVADILVLDASPDMIIYRVGGDEFIVLVPDADLTTISRYADKVSNEVSAQRELPNVPASISCGYALFNAELDQSLHDTIKRADLLMYEIKRERHKWIVESELLLDNPTQLGIHDLSQHVATDILTACKQTPPINPS